MPRVLVAVGCLILAGLVAVPEAAACSCAGNVEPRAVLRQADAAFVGTVAERRPHEREGNDAVRSSSHPVTLVFEVEEVVKGDLGVLVEVETHSSSISCGLGARVGARMGLFLGALERGGWTSSVCARIDPATLLAAAEPDSRASPRRLREKVERRAEEVDVGRSGHVGDLERLRGRELNAGEGDGGSREGEKDLPPVEGGRLEAARALYSLLDALFGFMRPQCALGPVTPVR